MGDLRHGLRLLLRNPGFTAVAVLSLSLGIGANTAVFSIINAIFLKPLPVEKPDRLRFVSGLDPKYPGLLNISFPNYQDYRDLNQVMSGLLLVSSVPLSLSAGGDPQFVIGQMVSGNYFSVLGVKPLRGRAFLPEEDQTPGTHAVMVISHGLWMRNFGGDPDIIGRTVRLNGQGFTVIGVAPPGFQGTSLLLKAEIWVPLMMYQRVFPRADRFLDRRAAWFNCIGRLKPGTSPEQALAGMKSIAAQLEKDYREANEGRSVTLVPLAQGTIMASFRDAFVRTGALLMSVVALVLVVACANIANLLLARAMARSKEIAIRRSMGAGGARIIRQLLTESLLLSTLGGALGLVVARWGRDLLWAGRPVMLRNANISLELDPRVLWFVVLTSLLTGILFGLAPALRSTRVDLVRELKERTSQSLGPRHALSARSLLVVGQVALSLVALVASGLFVRSLRNAQQTDPGFETRRMLTIMLDLGTAGYSLPRAREFGQRVLERVRAIPGVESATLAGTPPFGNIFQKTVIPEGRDGTRINALTNNVDVDYFAALGIPILTGRSFHATDTDKAPRVAVVNQTLANRCWPGQQAVGKRFFEPGRKDPIQVAGVARDAQYVFLGEDPRAFVYVPMSQEFTGSATLHVRTRGDPATMLGAVRREVQSLDPVLLLRDPKTLRQTLDNEISGPRMAAALMTLFGGLTLLLATIGIYGVVAYSVNQRVREIGIRMALGAQPGEVVRQVLREGMTLVGTGLVVGIGCALALTRLVSSLLLGVQPRDPMTFASVSVILVLVGMLACYLPARRAVRVDVAVALRDE